ncbi:hypothetical protein [Cryptosporangium arvum]|uniref:hypothetical protein n=1 Tax=Cryptosporangium arvum TaxID=80871 RepID=UPI0005687C7F|nr:hypothetical protein [Cryptosporangium arvum]
MGIPGVAGVLGVLLGVGGPHPPAVPVAAGAPPPAPLPYVGGPRGCVIPDPSDTDGCVTAPIAWLTFQVRHRFGDLPVSCWDEHAWNPRSDHPHGRACDYTIGRIGAFPDRAGVRGGWELARWLRTHAIALRVHYVIFQGRIWSWEHDGEGWRPYRGAGVYDPADVTGGHYDHVHVSTVDKRPALLFAAAANRTG